MNPVSKGAAQRLASAARALSEDDPAPFVLAVGSHLGLPLDEQKLQTLTFEDLHTLLCGPDGLLPEATGQASMKEALRHLWGEADTSQVAPDPEPEPAAMQGQPSLQIAVASNHGHLLDGHFGSCLRFLIYKVSQQGYYLARVVDASHLSSGSERNEKRAALLEGCQLLYVQSIGGPAAAKVVRAGVHPIKFPLPGPASEAIEKLQQHLEAPPPWLARVLNKESSVNLRFTGEAEE